MQIINDFLYHVVINHENQYSLWPQGRTVPAGWKIVKENQTKEECLAYIKQHWVDMRPKSIT